MSGTSLSAAPPVLPVPRQPSPLSFSSMSANDTSPPLPTSPTGPSSPTSQSPPVSTRSLPPIPGSTNVTPSAPGRTVHPGPLSPIHPNLTRPEEVLPVDPLPDSLLLRSTFTALEHSAATLKRLSKSVLASTASYLSLLEQLDKAEDEVFVDLGELGRWLEGGYGVQASSVWDDNGGIRRVRRQVRRKEREDMEAMVENSLRAVKAEIKRNGLAGGGAQSRFESAAKHFYQQTSVYLSPQAAMSSSGLTPNTGVASQPMGPGVSSASSNSSQSHPAPRTVISSSGPSDLAQAARLANFDLARYSHHSTLLYAVPPSSIVCVDILVGLYSWVGGLLGETPERRGSSDAMLAGNGTLTPPKRLSDSDAASRDPQQVTSQSAYGSSTTGSLKNSLSSSLSKLAAVRADLLQAWAERNQQTQMLEDAATERHADYDGTVPDMASLSRGWVDVSSTPISSSGIEHKRPKKMHKLHLSVGGRLRELLSSSSGATANVMPGSDRPAERVTRSSFDGGLLRGDVPRLTPTQTPLDRAKSHGIGNLAVRQSPELMKSNVPLPDTEQSSRPQIIQRRSGHTHMAEGYQSAFNNQKSPLPFESVPDLRLRAQTHPAPGPQDPTRLGGVGGLGAGGDEDEMREEAGRKKEGVLWGTGTWEGLSKGPSKGRWENFWVVLDHSKIYEYRDNGLGRPETAHAIIDLKFASVREGRGTDRRFVFEIVTPTQGRRQYQATSEQEMRRWLYAICNAIESSINGSSSVRTFDTSKLRTVSGSLDDHALPARRLFDQPSSSARVIGLGLPMPSITNPGAGKRRSMPPPPRSPIYAESAPGVEAKRGRTPSFKKVLRQSAEIAGGKWNNVVNPRRSSGLDFPLPVTHQHQHQTSSTNTKSSMSTDETEQRPKPVTANPSPAMSRAPTVPVDRSPWHGGGGGDQGGIDIENCVMEMAGLGIGVSPRMRESQSSSSERRVHSDGAAKTMDTSVSVASVNDPSMIRTRSADGQTEPTKLSAEEYGEQLDMKVLRRIADLPENRHCADCGKGMRSSRWATLSLRDAPMVLFLCIRCVGVHRGLGTHVSKPRSVDLDIWSRESILLANQWGNEKGNAVWEARKPPGPPPADEYVAEYIKAKYVDGRWLSDEHKQILGLASIPADPTAEVGKAV